MNAHAHANRNTFWASIFVDELARAGVQHAVVAPGSRSTPLALALANTPHIQVVSLLDERGAAFFALGMARATQRPVVVLSSSGTATANFYPAVIEAAQTRVPLIVITADRPHELRQSGANQTIDQLKLYGDHVRWFFDMPLPEATPPDHVLRAVRQLAVRAVAEATGRPRGPVHLNFPFRKPLEPTPVPHDLPTPLPNTLGYRGRSDGTPFTHVRRGRLHPDDETVAWLSTLMQNTPRGVFVLGKHPLSEEAVDALARLARVTGYPVLADALSGARFGHHLGYAGVVICTGYELFLPFLPKTLTPDLIVHLGGMPVSAQLENFLARTSAMRIVISEDGAWEDAVHTAHHWIESDAARLLSAIYATLSDRGTALLGWTSAWGAIDGMVRLAIESAREMYPDAEEFVIADVLNSLPEESALVVGNSLPVRHLDLFGRVLRRRLHIFANRGASGIDGVVSTALGVAAARPHHPTVLVIGDVSFYHDMNALLAVQRAALRNIHIVVLNNGGGAIFKRLPIAQYDPPFRDLFYTAHAMHFKPVADMFGMAYVHTASRARVRTALDAAIATETPTLIEFQSDPELSEHVRHFLRDMMADLIDNQTK